ncbi:hypothetical protein EVAR_987_1 [Eumeta japonica]|uniref:DUF5641 domain-containing protein n=1 Tax=Eumeta variegata TaxID=151549 RepID=A0A4C1SEI1_EUMVA|nr:hypothetical protein EVAR_987_1 [Eumeta japonica]
MQSDPIPTLLDNVALSSNTLRFTTDSHVLLSTALVKVLDTNGSNHNNRTTNFITEELCSKLGVTRQNVSSIVTDKYSLSYEERLCEQKFLVDTKRKDDGRFVVTIPLKRPPEVLDDSYQPTKLRFLSLKRRFQRQPEFRDKYMKFMKEYLELHHMSESIDAGLQLLLAHIRQTYWPLGGENLSKNIVNRCIKCSRFKAQVIKPIKAQLPSSRTELIYPFIDCGVDYAGPVLIADKKVPQQQPQAITINIGCLQRYERMQHIKQHFCNRFSTQYITLLQQRHKWKKSSDYLQVGTLVVIKDKALPPGWLLGRIINVHPGKDGVIRVADIKTKKGVI